MDSNSLVKLAYLVAAAFFILGLKNMTHPKTAVRGNRLGAFAMLLALGGTTAVAVVTGDKTIMAPKLIAGDKIQFLLTGSDRVLYTQEQATALYTNKTEVWENGNGMFFGPEGKAISKWDGMKEPGKWWVNDEGGVCYLIPSWGAEPCESFFDGDDEQLMSLYKGKEDVAAELREGNVLSEL